MNKVAYLKLLIGVITFLIFLTMGGIVYGLLNYKSTPKLITDRNKSAATVDGAPVVRLNLTAGKEKIKAALPCGEMLCLHVESAFDGDGIIVFDPARRQVHAVIRANAAPQTAKKEKTGDSGK